MKRRRQTDFVVVAWGTYDLGKPRGRIILRGLRESGLKLIQCHYDLWSGIEDKSQIAGWPRRLSLGLKWLLAYPRLLYRYLRLPKHDAILIPYMGQLDVLTIWPFAKLRGVPVVWDAFLSLYNTVVEDRRLLRRGSLPARLLFAWEWLACRAADAVLVDTNAHGEYFAERFGVSRAKLCRCFVGAEPDRFYPSRSPATPVVNRPFRVLFYGQFIPLHGIDTVVRAAKHCEQAPIAWQLIGVGQEAERIRQLIRELNPRQLSWQDWVSYETLVERIHQADVCLGIFDDGDKARRVIPNKVFQIAASAKPLITADTPAIRELLEPADTIILVPSRDPAALAEAVRRLQERAREEPLPPPAIDPRAITPVAVVQPLTALLTRLSERAKQTTAP
jgi:glycosyltransferase involved in cell wall biosynthesis